MKETAYREVLKNYMIEKRADGVEHAHVDTITKQQQQVTDICDQFLHRNEEALCGFGLPLHGLRWTRRKRRFRLED